MKESQREKKARQRQLKDRFAAILIVVIVTAMIVTLALIIWN